MKRYFLLAAASLLSYGAWAQAPEPTNPSVAAPLTFEALDKDANQKLTPSEAVADQGLARDYTAVDTNRDGYISREEFDAYHKG